MMKKLLVTLVFGILGFGVYGQTIKTLGYNSTNGQIVANTGTNALTFTNASVSFGGGISIQALLYNGATRINLEETFLAFDGEQRLRWQEEDVLLSVPLSFSGTNTAPNTRTNLGLGATWLTNTNVTNFRSAIGLGATNEVSFASVNYSGELAINNAQIVGWASTIDFEEGRWNYTNYGSVDIFNWGTSNKLIVGLPIEFSNTTNSAITRTNLSIPLPALTNTSNVTMMRALSGSTNTNPPYSGSISVTGTNNTNTLIFSNGILQSITTP